MKKYLTASILIIGFAGSAYAVTGQFGNMCSWVSPITRTCKRIAPSMRRSRARPTASAARTPRANL